MIRLAVAGSAGRMGKAILSLAHHNPGFKIAAALEHRKSPDLGRDAGEIIGVGPLGIPISSDAKACLQKSDVLIDFTHPTATQEYLAAALKTKTPYVIGTTGFNDKLVKLIKNASKRIGIVMSPNMSIGVNLLFKIAEITGKALDEDYDIEIVETHHRMKKDAPSGTALKLLEVLADARKKNLKKVSVFGRSGECGKRPKGQIGVMAVRGGDVVGDHTVSFFGSTERIELTHRASSRDAFAQGSLCAAKFICRRKSGLYNMQQVLGIAS